MLSAAINCHNITDKLSIEANSVDPEQTAPTGAVCRSSLIWVYTVCHRDFLNI